MPLCGLVVAIAIVYWVAIPRIGSTPHFPVSAARHSIHVVLSALEAYRDNHGSYPSEEQGLSVLPPGLLVQGVPPQYRPKGITDPWGRPLRYKLIHGEPRIRSAGPDAQFDTDDDITN